MFKGIILFSLILLLVSCKTELRSSECVWYREPSAEQCEKLYSVDKDLFRTCTLNKMDYNEFCTSKK